MTYSILENKINKINSVLLRFILVLNALLIVNNEDNNNFFEFNYSIIFITYLSLHLINYKLIKSSKIKSFIRLILDLLFIFLILYDKDIGLFFNYSLILIYFINFINHSGGFNNNILFFTSIFFLIILLDDFNYVKSHFILLLLISPGLFVILMRSIIIKFNDEIIQIIANEYIVNINENNVHRIFEIFIKEVKNNHLIKNLVGLEQIFLFTPISKNDNLILIKASLFVKNTPKLDSERISKIQEFLKTQNETLLYDNKINIDGIVYENVCWIKTIVQNKYYLYLVTFENNNTLFSKFGLKLLLPVFSYISRIFFVSDAIYKYEHDNRRSIKNKLNYVYAAQNALHYVKNKMGPIVSTIEDVDLYFKSDLPQTMKDQIRKDLVSNDSMNYIKSIVEKAKKLINGIDNILDEPDVIIPLKKFISSLRLLWINHFASDKNIIIELKDDELKSLSIKTNEDVFEFVFSDLVENMNKYSDKFKEVKLKLSKDNSLEISFTNDIPNFDRNYSLLLDIEKSYNNNENVEIYLRKNLGLNVVKRFLKEKKIKSKIKIDENEKKFIFYIYLPLIYENTNL